MNTQPTYDEALAELQQLLEQLQAGQQNLDEMYRRVERAAFLIRLCRERLRHTEDRVNELLNDEEES